MRYKTFIRVMLTAGWTTGFGGLYALHKTCNAAGPPIARGDPNDAVAGRPGTAGIGDALRPMDKDILVLVARSISGEKLKDAFPSKPYKVNIYRDAGQQRVNRLKIDFDRDEKWDEKWTFEGEGALEKVKRQVAPADDETYSVEYRLSAERWVRK